MLLGTDLAGRPVHLPLGRGNVLVAGDPGSGKSWVTGLLCEQLVLARRGVCVIDPEGDYTSLATLPGVGLLGHGYPPSLKDVERALRATDASVVVDLSEMAPRDRVDYVPLLLGFLAAARRLRGSPRHVVIDEAHYYLGRGTAARVLDLLPESVLATYKVSDLGQGIMDLMGAVIVRHESDPHELRALQALLDPTGSGDILSRALTDLGPDEAVLAAGPGRGWRRFRTGLRVTSHVRHRRKYTDVPLPPHEAFVFTRDGSPLGPAPRTLSEFSSVLAAGPAEALEAHFRRHDFSRWISDVYRDAPLAAQAFALEEAVGQGSGGAAACATALAKLILDRYVLDDTAGPAYVGVGASRPA